MSDPKFQPATSGEVSTPIVPRSVSAKDPYAAYTLHIQAKVQTSQKPIFARTRSTCIPAFILPCGRNETGSVAILHACLLRDELFDVLPEPQVAEQAPAGRLLIPSIHARREASEGTSGGDERRCVRVRKTKWKDTSPAESPSHHYPREHR